MDGFRDQGWCKCTYNDGLIFFSWNGVERSGHLRGVLCFGGLSTL